MICCDLIRPVMEGKEGQGGDAGYLAGGIVILTMED